MLLRPNLVLLPLVLAACHDSVSWSRVEHPDATAHDVSFAAPDTPVAGDSHGSDVADPAPPGTSIAALIALAASGTRYVDLLLAPAIVTYVRATRADEPTAFFVQQAGTGPALVVITTLATELVPGDRVRFVAHTLSTGSGITTVSAITDLVVEPTAFDVDQWARDPLTIDWAHGTPTLVRFDATVTGDYDFADRGYLQAPIVTRGLALALRMPDALMRTLGLHARCTVQVERAVVWRTHDQPQPTVFDADDVSVSCSPRPPPPVAAGAIVINEVDYAGPGPELVELYNRTDQAIDLAPYDLQIIDGSTIALAGTLAPHAYAVIGPARSDDVLTVPLPPSALPDGPAHGLRLVARDAGRVIDAVLYDVTTPIAPALMALGEGTPSPLHDDPHELGSQALARCPDHGDTDDNFWDFAVVPFATPGAPNGCLQ